MTVNESNWEQVLLIIQGSHILTKIIFEMNVTMTSEYWLNLARNTNKKGNVAFLKYQHISMPFLKDHHYHYIYFPDHKQYFIICFQQCEYTRTASEPAHLFKLTKLTEIFI